MTSDGPPDVAGFLLDGAGPIVISAAENDALCRGMGVAANANGEAHPSYYYTATQIGMGLTVRELCAKCDFNVDDGPMMATSAARYLRPLMTETPYWVRGRVESLVRKRSRKLGVMDLLDYRLQLIDAAGVTVLEADNVWVLPRPGLA
ncbi:MAG: hypothetical protein KF700_02985 [Hyphomonadaceae bacterium]|nr:hypothetical protein [Hyphomonadaceae bacterium]